MSFSICVDKLAKGSQWSSRNEEVTSFEAGKEGWAIMLGRRSRIYTRFILEDWW